MMVAAGAQFGSFGGLVVLALVGVGVWLLLSPRSQFVIRIHKGTARLTRGKVSVRFVTEVEDILRRTGVSSATIRGEVHGPKREIKLRFSRSIPPPVRQQIRNAWQWV